MKPMLSRAATSAWETIQRRSPVPNKMMSAIGSQCGSRRMRGDGAGGSSMSDLAGGAGAATRTADRRPAGRRRQDGSRPYTGGAGRNPVARVGDVARQRDDHDSRGGV